MNGNWTQGGKDGLIFCSDAEFADFISVSVDSKVIDAKNYTVKEGSTIVTLKADYLDTLSAGKHTLSINSANGSAETTFTIAAKSAENNNTNVNKDATSPKTGDNGNVALWFALLFVSCGGVIGTTVYSKKKREFQ